MNDHWQVIRTRRNHGEEQTENSQYNLEFRCPCGRQKDFVRSLRTPAFFSVLMIDGKFVFTKKIFAAVSGFFRLIRMVRESSRMDQRAEKDSGEGPRGQLGAGV